MGRGLMGQRRKKRTQAKRVKPNSLEEAELQAKLQRIIEPELGPAGVLSANQENPPKVVKDETD